ALVSRCPVCTRPVAGVALDGTPDGVRGTKHRLDASALHGVTGVEREPQHGYAVLGPSCPWHLLVRTSCPLLRRHHRAILHLPYDRNDDDLAYARARRDHPPTACHRDSSPPARASARQPMVMLARAAHLDRMCCVANQPHDARARRELRDLQVCAAPDRLDDDITARCAAHPEPPQGPTRIVGRRWHTGPDP